MRGRLHVAAWQMDINIQSLILFCWTLALGSQKKDHKNARHVRTQAPFLLDTVVGYTIHWSGTPYLHASGNWNCPLSQNVWLHGAKARSFGYMVPRLIHPRFRKKREFCLASNDLGFACAGISNRSRYNRNGMWYHLSVCLQTYCHLNSDEKLKILSVRKAVAQSEWWWIEEGCHNQ